MKVKSTTRKRHDLGKEQSMREAQYFYSRMLHRDMKVLEERKKKDEGK
jgi:hypothetical protein